MTVEKWFASGESKIFRLSRKWTILGISIISKACHISSEKDFEPPRGHFSKVSLDIGK